MSGQDRKYTLYRIQVFAGIFLGYAGYYLVRKNFSLAIPDLLKLGYSKLDLGFALSGVSIAYGISKFVMGYVSDRSNARFFLPLGLVLSASIMIIMGTMDWAISSISIMFLLLLVNGWFQGMGWAPCGRVVVHWFPKKERGRVMSLWNVSHNIGGGLIGVLAIAGMEIFYDWKSSFYFPGMIAMVIAIIAFICIRDTPEKAGLPPVDQDEEVIEEKLSIREGFVKYILKNKLLWYIAIANIFIYMVRYGVLDWAPTYLKEVKGYSVSQSGWSYFAYEYAGIPGTIICGWISDKYFSGRRAPATVLYMLFVLIAVVVYWLNPPGNILTDQIALITIGFFIYGPVMLIGVFALDLVPKNAAGTAAGFTGLFGYLGGAVLANIAIGFVVEKWNWDAGFALIILACILTMVSLVPTWKKEINFNSGNNHNS